MNTLQGKRGKALENLIDYANNQYKSKGLARVDKVPTPWNVSFDRRTGRVFRAFPEKKGTVDYIGVSHGKPIAFDAKSTKIKTSFPLKNIQEHQIRYLQDYEEQGGISFFIVEFEPLKEIYLITINQAAEWWVQSKRGGRKSIPYKYFKDECIRITSGNGIAIDYLEGLKQVQ